MGFANLEDLLAIEKEIKWEDRDLPATLLGLLVAHGAVVSK